MKLTLRTHQAWEQLKVWLLSEVNQFNQTTRATVSLIYEARNSLIQISRSECSLYRIEIRRPIPGGQFLIEKWFAPDELTEPTNVKELANLDLDSADNLTLTFRGNLL
jgi:hypothetical protein